MSGYGDPPVRACFVCGAEIRECMGFCLARDVLAALEGRVPALGYIREFCWRCSEKQTLATLAAITP